MEVVLVDPQNAHRELEINMTDFKDSLLFEHIETVTVEETLETEAKQTLFATVPVGSIIDLVNIEIIEDIVTSGTTTALGIGGLESDFSEYGLTVDLLGETIESNLILPSILANELEIYVNGVTINGLLLGSGNITAGKVRVTLVYRKPVP